MRVLPSSLDEGHLLLGLNMLLESEHAHTLSSMLKFLYSNMGIMRNSTRVKLMHGILREKLDPDTGHLRSIFMRLFCCWHDEVRRLFQHLLVYRAFRTKRNFLPLTADKMLLGGADERHLLLLQVPPESVAQSDEMAHDICIAKKLDWYFELLLQNRDTVCAPRRMSARAVQGNMHRSHSGKRKPLVEETYYTYGKTSLKQYTQTLVSYYTKGISSSSGMVPPVELAEILFGEGAQHGRLHI